MPAKRPPIASTEDFFEQYGDKVQRDGECLIWTGARTSAGYGAINRSGQVRLVHRLVYELTHGPLTPGMVTDHICHQRACCQIGHLREVTRTQNNRYRGVQSSQNTSGARGVSWDRRSRRWEVRVRVDNKQRWIGYYSAFSDAKAAAIAARERLYGEFAGIA